MKPRFNLEDIDRRLMTILLIVFVQMVGQAMIIPILPIFAKREFSLTPQAITLLISSFFAAQFLAGPYLGRLSDKNGRLPILIISQIGTVVSYIMLGLAPGSVFLYISRILDGITGGNIIVAQAYVTDVTPREKRTQALGYISAVFGIGFIIGPAVGGVLSAFFGPRIPYLFAAGVVALTVLLTWLILDETISSEQKAASRVSPRSGLAPSDIAQNFPLLLILIVGFIGQFGFGLLMSTFSLFSEAVLFSSYSEEFTNLGIGLLLAVVGLSQFITQVWLLPRLLKRMGEVWLVIAGNIARGLGMVVFAVITTPWLGSIASILFALGMGLLMPSIQSLSTNTVSDEMRGGVLGLFQSTISLAVIFSTAIAGVIYAVSPTTPYWLGAGLSFLALLPALALFRLFPQEEKSSVSPIYQ